MKRLAFNIETAADPSRLALIPEPEVATGNLKDPVKIAEKIAAAKAAQIEKAALDPNFAQVICISFAYRNTGDLLSNVTLSGYSERELVAAAWDMLRDPSYPSGAATYNGAAFDVPFLTRRSLLLGVRPVHIECNKYHVTNPETAEHLDVMQALHQGEPGNGLGSPLGYARNLSFYAKLILGEDFPYADLDQSKLGELMAGGQADTVRQLCEWNAVQTLRLAEIIAAQ